MERPSCHHEFAFALVMNRPGLFFRGIYPCLDDFEDEEVVFRHQLRINDLAFQAGKTLGDEWSRDPRGGLGSESKVLELVHQPA